MFFVLCYLLNSPLGRRENYAAENSCRFLDISAENYVMDALASDPERTRTNMELHNENVARRVT